MVSDPNCVVGLRPECERGEVAGFCRAKRCDVGVGARKVVAGVDVVLDSVCTNDDISFEVEPAKKKEDEDIDENNVWGSL